MRVDDEEAEAIGSGPVDTMAMEEGVAETGVIRERLQPVATSANVLLLRVDTSC